MKRILLFGALLAGLAFETNAAHAQMMLQKAVISSGGAASSNATMQMGSTAGQPVVGVASNSTMRAELGFWNSAAAASNGVGPKGPAMDFSLQAWPNPTSSETRLTLTLGSSEDLDLRLFDLTGKQVRAIFRGPASGTLGLDLDLSGLPSGSYILAARIPGQLVEKRISVIR
jgi:hypothetical protein